MPRLQRRRRSSGPYHRQCLVDKPLAKYVKTKEAVERAIQAGCFSYTFVPSDAHQRQTDRRRDAVEAERQACAALAESITVNHKSVAGPAFDAMTQIAAAIRARK